MMMITKFNGENTMADDQVIKEAVEYLVNHCTERQMCTALLYAIEQKYPKTRATLEVFHPSRCSE
jgi:hypothetical protein